MSSPNHFPYRDFILKINHESTWINLLEHLNRVAFFLKNGAFEIIAANRFFYERLGLHCESDILGKNDYQLFPKKLADKFRRDDMKVMQRGNRMVGMIELFPNRQGLPKWYSTNKFPVYDKNGRICGIVGTVQAYDRQSQIETMHPAIANAMKQMLEKPGEIDSLTQMATNLGFSFRSFDRNFKQETGLTPKQFLVRSRIQSACSMLLKSNKPISTIALDIGFCDQSAFTVHFRKRMGITPLQYKKKYSKPSS